MVRWTLAILVLNSKEKLNEQCNYCIHLYLNFTSIKVENGTYLILNIIIPRGIHLQSDDGGRIGTLALRKR